jgi:hypothetical protein
MEAPQPDGLLCNPVVKMKGKMINFSIKFRYFGTVVRNLSYIQEKIKRILIEVNVGYNQFRTPKNLKIKIYKCKI